MNEGTNTIKLSPAYRNDNFGGLADDIRQYMDDHFLGNLPNRDYSHPKLLVVFSGGNAIGKSALSQRISDELHGVVIENDAVKLHLLNYKPDIDRNMLQLLTWQYTMDLYQRVGDVISNGLIVRDGVIDWYYDRILPLFERQGFELFIIGYTISREKLIELIHNRGDKPTVSTRRLINQLGDHDIHQKRFRADYTSDIMLTDETVFDHDRVIAAIRSRIDHR
jgi:predicted kinase